jgi:hypothetical protein
MILFYFIYDLNTGINTEKTIVAMKIQCGLSTTFGPENEHCYIILMRQVGGHSSVANILLLVVSPGFL